MADTVDAERVHEYEEKDMAAFNQKIDTLANMVRNSKYTVFFTGAGVSTSCGVGDYRGPTGAWTQRKIKQLQRKQAEGAATAEDQAELSKLLDEAAKAKKKSTKKVSMLDAEPSLTHMAQATLIHKGLAHFVVTTNLDGIYRKAGIKMHTEMCNLHGDIYVERCTACHRDFERNYHVRQDARHVHDHKVGVCGACGSKPSARYTGHPPAGLTMKNSKWGGVMVGTRDENCGTKDTHINFGEYLDNLDWDEAEKHCAKADLCIVAGTSMSLRHITHFPFLSKQTVIINLQTTPDDAKCHLRIWAQCDPVFDALLQRLGVELEPLPVWIPQDYVPVAKIPKWVDPYYVDAAKRLESRIVQRVREAQQQGELCVSGAIAQMKALSVGGDEAAKLEEEEKKKDKQTEKVARKQEKKEERNSDVENKEAKAKKVEKKTEPAEKNVKGESQSESSARAPLSVPLVPISQFLLGNTCVPEKDNYRWCMFVRPTDSSVTQQQLEQQIDRVVFTLHETFRHPVVTVKEPPFELARVGWGTFTVRCEVFWRGETNRPPTKCSHCLSFDEPETATLVKL